jgi:MFS transporter, PPP family, 3-phenylpropionic acid transporter
MTRSFKIGMLYLLLFLPQGIIVPFLPLWMVAQEVPLQVAGVLIASSYVWKTLVNPVMGRLSDRMDTSALIAALALLTATLYFLFPMGSGWLWVAALMSVIYVVQPGMYPLCERLAVDESLESRISYGRFRLWGSVGFAAGGVMFGWAANLYGLKSLNIWIAALFGAVSMTAFIFLRRPGQQKRHALSVPTKKLLKDHYPALISGASIQASNAFLYAYGGVHLVRNGWTSLEVGLLWSVGIAFEIAALATPAKILQLVSVRMLFLMAGVFTAIRWVIFSAAISFPILAAAQLLQAFTIGVNNIAFMTYINGPEVDSQTRGALVGLYASLANGAFMGLMILICNFLYPRVDSACFLLMAALAFVGAMTYSFQFSGKTGRPAF